MIQIGLLLPCISWIVLLGMVALACLSEQIKGSDRLKPLFGTLQTISLSWEQIWHRLSTIACTPFCPQGQHLRA